MTMMMITQKSMSIRKYLFDQEMTFVTLAAKIDCHPAYLSRISKGVKRPSSRMARCIEQATEGYVTAKYLLEEVQYKNQIDKYKRKKALYEENQYQERRLERVKSNLERLRKVTSKAFS